MSARALYQIRRDALQRAKDLAYDEAVAAMDRLTLFTDRKAIDRQYRAKLARLNAAYERRKGVIMLRDWREFA